LFGKIYQELCELVARRIQAEIERSFDSGISGIELNILRIAATD
jgi:hypothetical protein